MADGPPDFTDLLAALEPPAALNVDHNHPPLSVSHGQMRGGLPQSQIQFLDQQQQQISQYGQRISHFPQMNSLTLSSQGNFQHSIVQKNDTGTLLSANLTQLRFLKNKITTTIVNNSLSNSRKHAFYVKSVKLYISCANKYL